MQEWKCDRCGQIARTREERRKHMKCPPTSMERTQFAMACADEDWCQEVAEAARAGSKVARKILVKIPEGKRDLALLRKMTAVEEARMASLGLKLDGTPLETATTEEQNESV